MIKMIATDLDGTMLKNDWSVSGINAKAVETAQGQGVRWMTVTEDLTEVQCRLCNSMGSTVDMY